MLSWVRKQDQVLTDADGVTGTKGWEQLLHLQVIFDLGWNSGCSIRELQ